MTRDEQLIRAALEMAAEACADYPRVAPDESEWTHYDEQIAHSQACVRAIDPADVLAKVPPTERNQLTFSIAQIIDHPSVYMGGPSRNAMRIANTIMNELFPAALPRDTPNDRT